MAEYKITQYGKPLKKSLYTIDKENKVFISTEMKLVLDFSGLDSWTFKAGAQCTFNTGYYCTFNTGHSCTFNTGHSCTFNTGRNCTFNTGGGCNIETGSDCTFNTGIGCTLLLYDINTCTFKSYNGGLSIILDRRDNEAYKLTKEFVQLRKVKNG